MRTRMIVRRPSCHLHDLRKSFIRSERQSNLMNNREWSSQKLMHDWNPSWQMIIDYLTDFTLWFSPRNFYCKSMLRLWNTTMTSVRRYMNRKYQLKLLYDPYFQSLQTENRNIKIRNYSLSVWSCSRHVIKNLTYRELISYYTVIDTLSTTVISECIFQSFSAQKKIKSHQDHIDQMLTRHTSHIDTFLDVHVKLISKILTLNTASFLDLFAITVLDCSKSYLKFSVSLRLSSESSVFWSVNELKSYTLMLRDCSSSESYW